MDGASRTLWLFTGFFQHCCLFLFWSEISNPICRNNIIQNKSDVWTSILTAWNSKSSVLIFVCALVSLYLPAPPFHSLHGSLSSSCRLNLCLFIVCSSRAELWVSMLRGRRGRCFFVVHHNSHGSCLEGKTFTKSKKREEESFFGNPQVQINPTCCTYIEIGHEEG